MERAANISSTGWAIAPPATRPRILLFGDETARPLAGTVVDNWFANNLTGGQAEGLGRWSHADLAKFLATGINRHATAAGSMLEKVTASTSHMTDAGPRRHRRLSEKPAAADAGGVRAAAPRTDGARPRPFLAHCETCHAADGRPRDSGATADYPNLAGDTLVMGRDPTTVLRVILDRRPAPPVPGRQPVKPMPAFAKLDDGDDRRCRQLYPQCLGQPRAAGRRDRVSHALRLRPLAD